MISILCPTRNRPKNMERLVNSIKETSNTLPEIWFYIDEDDEVSKKKVNELEGCRHIIGERIILSDMWNKLVNYASSDILMFAGDDLIFRTKDWDTQVIDTFNKYPDKIIFLHGNDGGQPQSFGTHGFLHRKWVDTVGYLMPPYFSCDYGDAWLNEVANRIGRRIYIPVLIEHMHPAFGKGEWDQTHRERQERGGRDRVGSIYIDLGFKRDEDVKKLQSVIS